MAVPARLTQLAAPIPPIFPRQNLTRTGITDVDRAWPGADGSEAAHGTDAGATFVRQSVERGVDAGLPPSVVADLTVDAIRDGRFLVTTRPEVVEQALDVTRRLVDGGVPSFVALS